MHQPLTLPNLDPLAAGLDLDRFYAKLQDHKQARPLTVEEAGRAVFEYRQFLTLRREHPAVELVPTPLADLAWHAHILDTVAYHADCARLFGAYLHHKPVFAQADEAERTLMESYAEFTAQLWQARFGSAPSFESDRCRGKACHAKTTCRCR